MPAPSFWPKLAVLLALLLAAASAAAVNRMSLFDSIVLPPSTTTGGCGGSTPAFICASSKSPLPPSGGLRVAQHCYFCALCNNKPLSPLPPIWGQLAAQPCPMCADPGISFGRLKALASLMESTLYILLEKAHSQLIAASRIQFIADLDMSAKMLSLLMQVWHAHPGAAHQCFSLDSSPALLRPAEAAALSAADISPTCTLSAQRAWWKWTEMLDLRPTPLVPGGCKRPG